MKLEELSAREIQRKTIEDELDPVETAEYCCARVAAADCHNCVISITRDLAIESAEKLRERLAGNSISPIMAGVPVAIKDNICIKGYRTTCGSRMLDDFIPPYNATVVESLIEAGALIIGKTNMDEFAMGSTSETSHFGAVRNPHNPDYSPGGSSGGSAVAVAASHVPVALGSDTGGSVRQPAAMTGVVGFKPTYGSVSRYGLIAYASSFDQIGPIAGNVKDAALMLKAISFHDPRDSTSASFDRPDYLAQIDEFRPVTIGVPREYFANGVDDDVIRAVERAISLLGSDGYCVEEITLPRIDQAIAAYYVIATAEASSNLARYDGVVFGSRCDDAPCLEEMYTASRTVGFGTEVRRRIMLGTYVLSSGYYDAYYRKAMQVREIVKRDMRRAFEKVDVIVTPTSPTAGIRLGEKLDDPLAMYLADVFTVSANLIGTCAISLPCGCDRNGLPIGVQLIGRHFDDATLLKVAHRLESILASESSVTDA
jgi:aspartyl-tRNA(Asn)/glutamyl-tRNA(Gln) amidotransferase subunit A